MPRPNGAGALRHGSRPGNTPGTGRPPSAVRAAALLSFDKRIPVLESIADEGERDADRIKAIEVLGKMGLGSDMNASMVRERLDLTLEAIETDLPAEMAGPLIRKLRAIWTGKTV